MKHKSIFSIFSISLFFLIFSTHLQSKQLFDNNQIRIPLNGEWKIILGDTAGYSSTDFDDSAWDSIDLPGSIIKYSTLKTGKVYGTVWLRKKVIISPEHRNMGIILGRIANTDEAYFNGQLVGSHGGFPPDDNTMWNHPRHYFISEKLVNWGGVNFIAVRVSYFIIGEVMGNLALVDYHTLTEDMNTENFRRITFSYIAISLGILLMIIFLIFYILRPGDNEYLYYCLQILFGSIVALEMCNFWSIFPSTFFRFKILVVSGISVNIAHILFLHRIYDLSRRRIEKVLWAYLALISLVVFFVRSVSSFRIITILLIIIIIPIGVYQISCHITALYKKKPFAKTFSAFGIISIMCGINDEIVYFSKITGQEISLFNYRFEDMILHYGSMALYMGTALVLVYRFINLMTEAEDLNANLEHYVIENAWLTGSAGRSKEKQAQSIISTQSEEKIKKTIEYLYDNYSSDISREGLAASIDMHTDSFGKLFKTYTGLRIGDYIYMLRINEAVEKLTTTEHTIIEIAYSVGFESLRTFNRIFKKLMKTTPNNYRQTNKIIKSA